MSPKIGLLNHGTVCPKNSDPFYIVTYYIKWVTTSWIDGICVSDEWVSYITFQTRTLKKLLVASFDLINCI